MECALRIKEEIESSRPRRAIEEPARMLDPR